MTNSRREKEGLVRAESRGLSGNLITQTEPNGPASEAYRKLRTNLLYALVDAPPKVVMTTSPGSAEGKSTVCANLGVVLAQAEKDTLILDCDLRRPTMHEIFGLPRGEGLVNVLVGELSRQEAYQEPMPDTRLKVLTAGALSPDPAQFLGSRSFSELLASVRDEFDYVVVDSPPIGMVSDPLVLATQVDGVLLTLDARRTRRGEVRRAMRALTTVGADVFGTVMNRAVGNKNDYYSPYIG